MVELEQNDNWAKFSRWPAAIADVDYLRHGKDFAP
jgi:hypothetical protein